MKTRKPKLNVRLLRRIQRHILDEPRRFFMLGAVATGPPGQCFNKYHCWARDLSDIAPACGTAACIHGWLGVFSGKTPNQITSLSLSWSADKLGLSRDAAETLFLIDQWPIKFRYRYENAKTPAGRARAADRRIEWLITTGK